MGKLHKEIWYCDSCGEANWTKNNTSEAFETLKKAMSSICTAAILNDETTQLSMSDARRIGNDAASRFMMLCFGVETSA